MSDSPWSQLGLEPTNDTRTIRRAYRQRLPEHPPETDPEGFKRLRQAYEEALVTTSKPWAPWYAIPADNKHFMRAQVARIVVDTMQHLDLSYPTVDERMRRSFSEMREILTND